MSREIIAAIKRLLTADLSKQDIIDDLHLLRNADLSVDDIADIKEWNRDEGEQKLNADRIASNAQKIAAVRVFELNEDQNDRLRNNLNKILSQLDSDKARISSWIGAFEKQLLKQVRTQYNIILDAENNRKAASRDISELSDIRSMALNPTPKEKGKFKPKQRWNSKPKFDQWKRLAQSTQTVESIRKMEATLNSISPEVFLANLSQFNTELSNFLESGIYDLPLSLAFLTKYKDINFLKNSDTQSSRLEIARRLIQLCANANATGNADAHLAEKSQVARYAFHVTHQILATTAKDEAFLGTLCTMLMDLKNILCIQKGIYGGNIKDDALMTEIDGFSRSLAQMLQSRDINSDIQRFRTYKAAKSDMNYDMGNSFISFMAQLPVFPGRFRDYFKNNRYNRYYEDSDPSLSTVMLSSAAAGSAETRLFNAVRSTLLPSFTLRGSTQRPRMQDERLFRGKPTDAEKDKEARGREKDKRQKYLNKRAEREKTVPQKVEFTAFDFPSETFDRELSVRRLKYDAVLTLEGDRSENDCVLSFEFNGMIYHYAYDISTQQLILNADSQAKAQNALFGAGSNGYRACFQISMDDWDNFKKANKRVISNSTGVQTNNPEYVVKFIEFLTQYSTKGDDKKFLGDLLAQYYWVQKQRMLTHTDEQASALAESKLRVEEFEASADAMYIAMDTSDSPTHKLRELKKQTELDKLEDAADLAFEGVFALDSAHLSKDADRTEAQLKKKLQALRDKFTQKIDGFPATSGFSAAVSVPGAQRNLGVDPIPMPVPGPSPMQMSSPMHSQAQAQTHAQVPAPHHQTPFSFGGPMGGGMSYTGQGPGGPGFNQPAGLDLSGLTGLTGFTGFPGYTPQLQLSKQMGAGFPGNAPVQINFGPVSVYNYTVFPSKS